MRRVSLSRFTKPPDVTAEIMTEQFRADNQKSALRQAQDGIADCLGRAALRGDLRAGFIGDVYLRHI
jgi:hypothetical protein